MTVVARILAGAERRASFTEDVWSENYLFGTQRTHAGVSVTETSALTMIAVFASVRLLAGAIALCPLIVYRGEGRARERARDSWQWRLLHARPNDEHAPDLFYETAGGHDNLWGNFYAEKVKVSVNGRPVVGELWPVSPSKVQPNRDSKGRKVFEIDGNARSFARDKILHIPAFGTDGLKGLSPIAQTREELGAAAAAQQYLARFFANNAHPPGVVSLQGTLSPEAAEQFREQWEAMHRGLENSHRIAVLEQGATWQSIGMPLKDIEFVANARFTVNQIARLFQVPPEMIGGDRDSSMTYSTVEGQALHFVKFSLARWLRRIEQALKHDRDLFPEGAADDLYPEFLVEGLLRGDSQARATFYKTMYEMQALTRNEIRERENLSPLPGGDGFPMEDA